MLIGGLLLAGCERYSVPIGWSVAWETADPESHGMESGILDALREELAARRTTAFLVVRHGRIVYEWYPLGHGSWRRQGTASLAKALVGGMSLLVALDEGRLGVDDPVWKYIPAWKDDPLRSQITIRHLATHSSGIENGRDAELTGWKRAFWRREPDLFTVVLAEAPVTHAPGTRFLYSSPGFGVLSHAITASLRGAPETNIEELLRVRIMEPLGVPHSAWAIGYGRAYEVGGLQVYANWGGGSYTARAVARVGQLMLRKGKWGDRQVVDSAWVERLVSYAGTPLPDSSHGRAHPAPGLCWWTNWNGAWPTVPSDAFAGVGAGGQILLVVPSLDLVSVRFGEALGDEAWGPAFWDDLAGVLLTPLVGAVVDSD